ncbi:hypothetical protein RchiOBHm_Chr1g0321421 [Rosa chinensis]|uniref:Uncharacterized protein n=1 Tax=Rosa chinensis TaxID=74649 RepID=A0A2P6S8Y6_ROSCH|nr:hypothetical protein RchiOBHm_Chr1g0321421 [Rosa chinensis]
MLLRFDHSPAYYCGYCYCRRLFAAYVSSSLFFSLGFLFLLYLLLSYMAWFSFFLLLLCPCGS